MKRATKKHSKVVRKPRTTTTAKASPEVPNIQQAEPQPIPRDDPLYPRVEATMRAELARLHAEREAKLAEQPPRTLTQEEAWGLGGRLSALCMKLHAIYLLSREVDGPDRQRVFASQQGIEANALLGCLEADSIIRDYDLGPQVGALADELAQLAGVRHG